MCGSFDNGQSLSFTTDVLAVQSPCSRRVHCHLCLSHAPLDCYHLAVECTHPVIKVWRKRYESALRRLVAKLTVVIRSERERAGAEQEDRLFSRAARAARRADLNTAQGDFLSFRLLVAHPWPERMAQPHMRAVRLLGRVFDLAGVYHRFERPALDLWTRWSLRWLWRLSSAWRRANAA